MFLRKTNDEISKYARYPIFEHFFPNWGKNEFSTKIRLHHLLASYSPLTSCKKSEKTNALIHCKTLK